MKKIFKWFKRDKLKTQLKSGQQEFTFEILEAVKTGDLYEYTIKADNKKDAFIKLVKYFYGEECSQDVQSKHKVVTFRHAGTFQTNLPLWFAKRISGYIKEEKRNYQLELESFATKNNIKLKQSF